MKQQQVEVFPGGPARLYISLALIWIYFLFLVSYVQSAFFMTDPVSGPIWYWPKNKKLPKKKNIFCFLFFKK